MTPPRRAYHHGDLARALVDASVGLVRAEGVDRFSLRGAARAAAVDPAAVYRHFADRAALLQAVAAVGFAQLADAMSDAMAAGGDDAVARFRAAGLAYVHHAVEEPELFRLMFGSSGAGGAERPARGQGAGRAGLSPYEMLVDLVEPLLERDTPSEARERAAVVAWSAVHGLAHLAVHGVLDALHSLDSLVLDVVDVVRRGLPPSRASADA